MKFAVIGLGSMGKRRVRDLLQLGHAVVGFDIRQDRREEAKALYGIDTVVLPDKLLHEGVDACVISTPPDIHQEYYEWCFNNKQPFFCEANIFTPRAEWFAEMERSSGVRGYSSGTWRYHPLFLRLKEEVEKIGMGGINTVHYHYGGYLPYWHPWESYADFYAGQRKTSAVREMVPFEAESLVWLFGPVKAVCALNKRASEWETDMDDTYHLLLEFESGISGSLLVELHQVNPFRLARVSAREHSFTLDLAAQELLRYSLADDSWRKLKPASLRALSTFNFEDIYHQEIASFVGALEGKNDYPKTWAEDRHLSDILFAAELSSVRREWVEIKEIETAYDGRTW